MKKSDPLWKVCDALCRKIVRLRDGGKCRVCGQPQTDTIHIIDRDVSITRCDPANCYAGCRKHHNHGKPLDLIAQHISVVGKEEVFRLCVLSQQLVTYRRADLVLIREELKRRLNEIQS